MRHVGLWALWVQIAVVHAAAQGHAGTVGGGSHSSSYTSSGSSSGGGQTQGHASVVGGSRGSGDYYERSGSGGYNGYGRPRRYYGFSSGGSGGFAYMGDFTIGFTIGGAFSWMNGSEGFNGTRTTTGVTTGILPLIGGDGWLWMGLGPIRLGLGFTYGFAPRSIHPLQVPADAALEAGTVAGTGAEYCGVGALEWVPTLIWRLDAIIGARVGACFDEIILEARGRDYASLGNLSLAAGPELGVRLRVGAYFVVQLTGFVDIARSGSGLVTLGLGWAFEERDEE